MPTIVEIVSKLGFLIEKYEQLESAESNEINSAGKEKIFSEIKRTTSNLLKLIDEEQTSYKEKLIPVIIRKTDTEGEIGNFDFNSPQIKDFITKKLIKKKAVKDIEAFTLYKASNFGKIANYYVEPLTLKLITKYPDGFVQLFDDIISSGIQIMSKTYLSMALVSTILSIIFALLISAIFVDFSNIFMAVFEMIAITIAVAITVFASWYFYPTMVKSTRKKMIKKDLPFVIIHMAAVAGSGAHPMAMFNMLAESGDYPGLEVEIKKVLNYINVYGYDLSTALNNVARTTPSQEFKSLLDSLISTIKSGGSMKDFLDEQAEDALNVYRLERKKYVEMMATYSDVYTSVMIAAPLLFFTTLSIINLMGGAIAGISVKTVTIVGTFFVIPLVNIGFAIFLTMVEPD
ncbi:type II secretion system F family protein [Candidatus Woesearchaeota archaeon]|nr:type II secretion system F family protein [Candidatus Woesearchaeota archaeon]